MGGAFRARRGGDEDGNELWRWRPGVVPFYRVKKVPDRVVMAVVAGYGRGGEEEAAPVERGGKRRKSKVEDEAGGPDWAGLGRAR
jgi:hypothetical protein